MGQNLVLIFTIMRRIKMKQLMSMLLPVMLMLSLANLAFAVDKPETKPTKPMYKKYYEGTIGKNLEVSMTLEIYKSEIRGSYRYKKHRKAIGLKGSLMPDGVSFELTESADNKVSGRFKGKFAKDYNELQGEWSGKQTLPFALAAAANIVMGKQKEYNIEYETVEFILPDKELSQRLNAQLKTSIASFYKEYIEFYEETKKDPQAAKDITTRWEFTLNVADINYFPNKIVSITYDNMVDTSGAHPSVAIITVNIGIGKDGLYSITPAMMFKKDSAYLKKIADIYVKTLNKEAEADGFDPYNDDDVKYLIEALKSSDKYKIQQGGIEIAYQRRHAEGTRFVQIPYDKIKTIIAPDGPLGLFIK